MANTSLDSPHEELTPERLDEHFVHGLGMGFLPCYDEDSFDEMIDAYNRCTDGKLIWRRIGPNWSYKWDVLRKTRQDNYRHRLYATYRPELFDWEKALELRKRGEKIPLKSRAGNSRLTMEECDARKARFLELQKQREIERKNREESRWDSDGKDAVAQLHRLEQETLDRILKKLPPSTAIPSHFYKTVKPSPLTDKY